ncbi:MAG: hypothetical protein IKV30_02065 [Clostridia bacterium]|nr:hypothetical protein [Clostridia bacterium]
MKKYIVIFLSVFIMCLLAVDVAKADIVVTGYSLNFKRKEVIQLLNVGKDNPELAPLAETISKDPFASYYSKNIPIEERNKYVYDLVDFLDDLKLPHTRYGFKKITYTADTGYVGEGCILIWYTDVRYELYIPSTDEYEIFSGGREYDCEPRQIGEILLYESKENPTVDSEGKTKYSWEGYLELNGYRFKCYSRRKSYDEKMVLRFLQEASIYTLRESYASLGHDPDQEVYVPQESTPDVTPSPTSIPTPAATIDTTQGDREWKIIHWSCAGVSITAVVVAVIVVIKKKC